MFEDEIDRPALDQLERRDLFANRLRGPAQQGQGGARIGYRDQGSLNFRGLGKQFQHGRGDHAKGTLGPDEKLFQIIARIVLAQAAQAVPDSPVGQHYFQAQHQITRIAIA